jgi:hypothetical protein
VTRAPALAVLALVLLLAACAERSDAGGSPAPESPAPTAALPEDGDVLVLEVAFTGGFVTPDMLASRLPVVSVYADGRVLSEGPVVAIYPGPAWPNVQLQQTDRETVQRLVDDALAAGVGDTTDLGSPPIADAPSTRFTVTTAEGTTVREAYALSEGTGATSGLTADQQAARAELAELLAELTDLPATLDAAGPYEPSAVAALARPWTAEPDPAVGERPAVPWPGPALPGEPVVADLTCVVATGEQAAALTTAARAADQLTPWTTPDGAVWAVTFRPLLPQETGCTDLGD